MNHSLESLRVLSGNCELLSTIQEESDTVILKHAANALLDYAATIEKLQVLSVELSKTTSLVAASLVINSINGALCGEHQHKNYTANF